MTNKVNFESYSKYVTDSLYQWDVNQSLKITGLDIDVVPEVHFSNREMDRAIVRQATVSNGVINVDIPNSLLQSPARIYAHIGIYKGDTFKTIEVVEIPVIARVKPADYQILDSDEEIYSFKELENKISNSVEVFDKKVEANNELINARVDNLLSAKGLEATEIELLTDYGDEYLSIDSIKAVTNGVVAMLIVTGVNRSSSMAVGNIELFKLPDELTPFDNSLFIDGGKFSIDVGSDNIARIGFNASVDNEDIYQEYNLANPYIYELIDSRVDTNGNVHTTAGEAVRTSLDNVSKGIGIKDDFLNGLIRSYNLNNPSAVTAGYFLSTDDEIIEISDSAYGFTDYINVTPNEKIIANHPWGAQFSVSAYDSNKRFVSQESYTENVSLDAGSTSISSSYWYVYTVPENVYYLRFNTKLTGTVKEMIIRGEDKSDIPTEYIEYNPEIKSLEFLKAVTDYTFNNDNIVNTEDNTVFGVNALPITDGVIDNVAVGAYAMGKVIVDNDIDNQSGRYNVAIGKKAMKETTTGNHNTACGFQAMMNNTTGTANTAVGEDALMVIGAGNYNVAVGCRALQSATEGDYNTAVGLGAGYWNDEMTPTGSNNTMIGAHSGQADGNGSDNTSVGYFAKSAKGLNHTIAIGSRAYATKSGQAVIGSSNITETLVYGDFVVNGSDGIRRKIIFKSDGSVSWESVTE